MIRAVEAHVSGMCSLVHLRLNIVTKPKEVSVISVTTASFVRPYCALGRLLSAVIKSVDLRT